MPSHGPQDRRSGLQRCGIAWKSTRTGESKEKCPRAARSLSTPGDSRFKHSESQTNLSDYPMGTRRIFSLILLVLLGWGGIASAFDRVIIDPGHGAHDRGGSDGYVYEKHLALDTARRVEALLKQHGLRTVMTRTRDTYPTLEDRSRIGNRYRNAIFVSIHYNDYWRSSSKGIETFYCHGSSYPLARYVQHYMIKRTHGTDRGAKRARFHVIRETTKNPAILVECGFLSNPTERRRAMSGAYRQMLAEGIVRGILEYRAAYR